MFFEEQPDYFAGVEVMVEACYSCNASTTGYINLF